MISDHGQTFCSFAPLGLRYCVNMWNKQSLGLQLALCSQTFTSRDCHGGDSWHIRAHYNIRDLKSASQNRPRESTGCLSVRRTDAVITWAGRSGCRCWRLRVPEWVDTMVPLLGVRTIMRLCACIFFTACVCADEMWRTPLVRTSYLRGLVCNIICNIIWSRRK